MYKIQGFTEQGNTTLVITGAVGTITRKVQGSFPSSTITVYDAGTLNLATIYSDDNSPPTAKANPFVAASDGTWFFYAAPGRYDVKFSGGGLLAPFTLGDLSAGIGASGVPSYAFASLPTSKTQNAGNLARVTDTMRGLWMDSGTQWIRQLGTVLNVRDFGAVGDGVTNDTAAIQAAINAATAGAVAGPGTYPYGNHFGLGAAVYIPTTPLGYVVSNLTILAPVTIFGDNTRTSRLLGLPGATGYMLNYDGFNAAASLTGSYVMPNMRLFNIMLEGNMRQANYGAIYMASMGYSHFNDVDIELFSREALKFYSSVIESAFSNIRMRYCGNLSTGHPEINLFDEHPVLAERDAHNLLTFTDIQSTFAFGDHIYIDTLAGRSYFINNLQFNKVKFHAPITGGTETGPVPTAAQELGKPFVIGSSFGTRITDCLVAYLGKATAAIYQFAGSHAAGATRTKVNGFQSVGHDGAGPFYGIQLTSGTMSIDNIDMDSNVTAGIITSAGTSLEIGPNVNIYFDPVSFAAGTVITKEHGSYRSDQAHVDKRTAITISGGNTVVTDASLGNYFYGGFGAYAITVNAPSNGVDGQELTYEFTGTGGGPPTIMTWNAVFNLTGGRFDIASSQVRSITFRYNGTTWVEMGRSEAKSSGIVTLTDAANIALDASLGSAFVVTLAGNRTLLNPTNYTPGQEITLIVIQDAVGGRTLAFDTAYKQAWSNVGNVANLRTSIRFVVDGAAVYLTQAGAQAPYMV